MVKIKWQKNAKIKLIYFHEKDTCHIVAVWDCRNNPTLLQDKLGEE